MATLVETVYRPPLEAKSALLEIALGCSYGKCSFCMYSNKETPLQLVSSEMLCENLEELVSQEEQAERMFFLGGNVLAFKSRFLLDVFTLVRRYLPRVRCFSMYARADDVLRKSIAQLKELKDAGLDILYIGVESGSAEILKSCLKGENPDEILTALHKLDSVGIRYGLSSILGLGGESRSRENALETGKLYSSVTPVSIRVMTLTPMKGTLLETMIKNGKFKLQSSLSILKEELLLIQSIECSSSCIFAGNHVSNSLHLAGILPEDKDKLIAVLNNAIQKMGDDVLQTQKIVRW